MTKTHRCTIAFFAVAFLMVGWIWRYISLNQYYRSFSEKTIEIYNMEEIVPFGDDYLNDGLTANGYSIRVDDFEIVDYEDFIEERNIDTNLEEVAPEKLALVHITLFNENSDAEGVMLTELQLHGIDNYVGIDRAALLAINPGLLGNYGITLSPNTEYSLIIPFSLYRSFFGEDTWNNILGYKFFFHITSFPIEKDIHVAV